MIEIHIEVKTSVGSFWTMPVEVTEYYAEHHYPNYESEHFEERNEDYRILEELKERLYGDREHLPAIVSWRVI